MVVTHSVLYTGDRAHAFLSGFDVHQTHKTRHKLVIRCERHGAYVTMTTCRDALKEEYGMLAPSVFTRRSWIGESWDAFLKRHNLELLSVEERLPWQTTI